MSKVPDHASAVPFVPVNWGDRDAIVGRLMGILEAVMPDGKQLEATKGLVKNSLSDYFRELFNNQYEVLTGPYATEKHDELDIVKFYRAIWEVAQIEQ
jgi:hypothetical protein